MTPLKLPDNWRLMRLGDCFALASGSPKPSDSTGGITSHADIPVYGGNGIMGFTAKPMFTEDQLIIGRVGEKCGCIHKALGRHWVTDNALYTKEWKIDRDLGFFFYLLDYANLNAHMSKGGQPLISQKVLYKIQLSIPPQSEQVLIASILSLWDHAVDLTEKLLAEKRTLRSWLMHELLKGKLRLSGFGKNASPRILTGDWHVVALSDLFKPIRRKNSKGVTKVLTASGEHGLVDQGTYFNRSVAGESLAGYFHLLQGEFAYNRSSMIGYPYGAIKRLDEHEEGVLSTLYICFAPTSKKCCSDFYLHLFESGVLNKGLRGIVQVGARAHGLLNVTLHDFFSLKVPCPSIAEQEQIASVLNHVDKEIILLRTKADALREQKRGLMQQLLTGKKRVMVCAS